MAMSFNPYQQRMPSFRRPPPRRSPFNPFMNRGIGGFGGMFGGRGPRRRPPPRGRFPQSFCGFGGRGRGRGGMFGGFPQSRGRGRQSPFSNLFGGIGGFGGRRQFNPFMNRFGGGGFAPSERRQPQDWDAFLEKIRSGLGSNFGLGGVKEDIPALEPQVMGSPEAPAAPPPMETTAPVMPAAPQPLAPVIPPMPPAPPTVGPPGTTITPPGPPPGVPAVTPTTPLPPRAPWDPPFGWTPPITPSDKGGGMILGGPSGGTIPGTNIPLPPNMPISRDPWGGVCPHPDEEILLADDSWIKAKDIQVGDKVKTLTAKDFKAGEYEITRVEIIDNQPRCEVFFKDSKSIISSYSHPYAVEDKGFVEAQNIQAGDTVGDLIVTEVKPLDWGSVVSLSVDKAETYMLKAGSEDKPVAVLSHNKSIAPPPAGPRPGEPGYEAWRVKKDAELGQKWAQNPPMPGTGHWTAYQKWLERGNNPIPAAQAMLETYPVSQPHGPPSLADEGSPEAPIGPPPTANQYGFTPGDPTKMYSQVMTPWVNKETGETYSAPNPGYQPPPGSAWEKAGFARMDLTQPPPTPSPQPLPMQPLPIGQQPLLPPMPGKEARTPPFIGRGPAAPLSPIPPVNVVQENIEREIIPPQLPVAPIGDDMVGYRGGSEGFYDDGKHIFNFDPSLANQTTTPPNTLGVQDREPGLTQADIMRPQMTGTPATAFPSLLPHQQFAPTNLMGEPQKKALRDILKGSFGFGGL